MITEIERRLSEQSPKRIRLRRSNRKLSHLVVPERQRGCSPEESCTSILGSWRPAFIGIAECTCVRAHARQRPSSNISLLLPGPPPFHQPPPSPYLQILPLKMTTSLDYLKATGTVVVSDSGDFECKLVSRFRHFSLFLSLIINRC